MAKNGKETGPLQRILFANAPPLVLLRCIEKQYQRRAQKKQKDGKETEVTVKLQFKENKRMEKRQKYK